MKIILTDINTISFFLKRNIKNLDNSYYKYAENICNEIIGDTSLHFLNKININKFETIFIKGESFIHFYEKKLKKETDETYKEQLRYAFLLKEILKGKTVFVCRLSNDKGFYEFNQPEPVCFELTQSTSDSFDVKRLRKRLDKVNKHLESVKLSDNYSYTQNIRTYLVQVNHNFLLNCINLAKRDFDFIRRFNNEMFHQNITYNNKPMSRDEIVNIYETDRFTKIIDLSDTRERIAFISLYGIAFKKLTLDDFYLIDGIFSLQPNRERDSLKQLSGIEVFKMIMTEDKQAVSETVEFMGEVLMKLTLPVLNLSDFNLLKKNYTLYCGISYIGSFFSRIILPDNTRNLEKYKKIAVKLIDYSLVEKYFDSILKNSFNYNQDNNYIYETLKRFEAAVVNKKTVAELDYGSKEFKV